MREKMWVQTLRSDRLHSSWWRHVGAVIASGSTPDVAPQWYSTRSAIAGEDAEMARCIRLRMHKYDDWWVPEEDPSAPPWAKRLMRAYMRAQKRS